MSSAMATTTTPSFVARTRHYRREISPDNQNGFISFKASSKISIMLSNFSNSTYIRASTLTDKTSKRVEVDRNAEICRFCKLGNLRSAMDMLQKSQNPQLESSTYCSILQLCADHKSLQDGKKVHLVISSNNVDINYVLGCKLVFMYVTCGDMREARRVFDGIPNEDVFLWSLLMNHYAKVGDFRESTLFKQMHGLGIYANSYTFSCVLKCFGALGSLIGGEQAHGYLLKLGFDSDNAIGSALISFYAKCKQIRSADKVFDDLSDRDVISWNSIISGHITNGFAEEGLEIFSEMQLLGVKMNLATMVSVLPACAEMGRLFLGRALHGHGIKACYGNEITLNNTLVDMYTKCACLDAAVRVFETMNEKSVVSWTSMMAGYAREGQLSSAIKLFHGMEAEGVKPDPFTVTSILHACASNGSLEDGKNLHDYVRRNNLQPSFIPFGSSKHSSEQICKISVPAPPS